MTMAVQAHIGRVHASLYCHVCRGDMLRATCTCEHELCRECVGCATCGVHDRGCSHNPRNMLKEA